MSIEPTTTTNQPRAGAVAQREQQISGSETPKPMAYQWVNHGPGNFFGQDVDYWMRIPPMNTPNARLNDGAQT